MTWPQVVDDAIGVLGVALLLGFLWLFFGRDL